MSGQYTVVLLYCIVSDQPVKQASSQVSLSFKNHSLPLPREECPVLSNDDISEHAGFRAVMAIQGTERDIHPYMLLPILLNTEVRELAQLLRTYWLVWRWALSYKL